MKKFIVLIILLASTQSMADATHLACIFSLSGNNLDGTVFNKTENSQIPLKDLTDMYMRSSNAGKLEIGNRSCEYSLRQALESQDGYIKIAVINKDSGESTKTFTSFDIRSVTEQTEAYIKSENPSNNSSLSCRCRLVDIKPN